MEGREGEVLGGKRRRMGSEREDEYEGEERKGL
jgi:hypothetical protein